LTVTQTSKPEQSKRKLEIVKYRITHKTWYVYAELAPVCHNLVHLSPRETDTQQCNDYQLLVDPPPAFLAERADYFGNLTQYFSIENAHRKLEITAESTVEVRPPKARDSKTTSWQECVVRHSSGVEARGNGFSIDPVVYQLTLPSTRVPPIAELRDYAAKSFTGRIPIVDAIVDLTSRIHRDFKFDSRATTVNTPLADVLRLRRGVCQDFAHLATGCLRAMGLAARYTSGYLRTIPPPGKPRLVGADVSHAWCSCWCGPLGWVDFDPTNDCLVDDSYVTIAWGRDYDDVCPIQGVFVGTGEHRIGVSVDVAPC
jgi:transglutaminase-like putative cysteine protease